MYGQVVDDFRSSVATIEHQFNLSAGCYLFEVATKGKRIGMGKIVIQQ
jgi:hypothetical protein